MPWVEVGSTDIYYVEQGVGQPIVFLHGYSSCAEAWFQQLAYFGTHYRAIAYDSVNHGHSSNSPRGEEEPDRADELEGFLRALGIERPILAGNSMGGDTVLRWAARHPQAAAALIPSGMGLLEPPALGITQEPLDHETLFLPTGDSFTERFKREQPRLYERYLRIRSTATRIEALRYPRPRSAMLADRATLGERIGGVTSPMLIIVGELDRLRPACERLHAAVPYSEYRIIPGAPHNVYYEAAAAYNAAVDEFLQRVLAAPAAQS